jgi:Tfp pilus assembly protein PilO
MNRKVLLAAAGAVLAVTGLWYLMLWSPQSSALSKANARNAAAVQKQSELGLQLRGLQKAKLTLPQSKERLSRLGVAIPDDPGLADLIDQVNGAAKAAGVDFLTLTPEAPAALAKAGAATTSVKKQTAPGVQDLTLSVTAQGAYFQLTDFMNKLNALPRLVVMDSVALTGQDKTMTLQVGARTFLHDDTPPPTTPPTTVPAKGASS